MRNLVQDTEEGKKMNGFMRPPRPADEEERLGVLHAAHLLDTQPEEVFDRVTRLTCSSLNVPICLISLVDKERQWFKSSCGLEAAETSRDVSFCGHAILSDEPFIVPDTSQDARFAFNPLVVGAPRIRFYAGVPIHLGNQRIGTLCVIDTSPRVLTTEQVRLLKSLARTVEDLLHLRQSMAQSVSALSSWPGDPDVCVADDILALRRRLSRDYLTGLPGRHAIDAAVLQLAADHAQPIASGILALMDIDNLSAINERLGHEAGDRVIAAVGERLILASEPGDVAARIGGGLFALLLGHHADFETGVSRLATLHETLNALVMDDEATIYCSITTGYVPLNRFDTGGTALLDIAHEAVRQAKALGHGLMSPYNRALGRLGQRALEHDLRAALRQQQFVLAYQVKMCTSRLQPTGVEALLRWRHPSLGMVSPAEFIPVAEESGVIVQLGLWTLHAACRQAAQWYSEGRVGCAMAVNVSPRQFLHGDIVNAVKVALAESGLPPRLLELELTETVAVCDVDRAVDIMNALKQLGVVLSIDDFGTGYSSLSYLLRLPIDKLKIDRAFVSALADNRRARAIVKGVIDICAGLGIDVVAEGVETAEQVALLTELGCSEMQGFHFGRPTAPAHLDSVLIVPADIA